MISTLPALVGTMVLNFENDLTQKCAHHVSYDIHKHIFFFGRHRYYNHFVLRVHWIYHFCRVKKNQNRIPYEHFMLHVFPVLNFRWSLFNNFLNLIIQKQTKSTIDRLNVPTNVLDVPTDLVRTKSEVETAPPWLPSLATLMALMIVHFLLIKV